MKIWKALLSVLFAYLIFIALYLTIELTTPLKINNITEIHIPKGVSFSYIASSFKEKGIIKNELIFKITGRILGIEKRAKSGYYLISKDMSLLDIFTKLIKGKIIEYTLTVVEGDSLFEIAEKLSKINPQFGSQLFEISKDTNFLKILKIDAPSLEGYLYPATYNIPKGMDLKDIITMMVKKFWNMYDKELLEKTREMGWTVNQVVTLASIIEKEAKLEEEKPIISAVYHNRLKIGMPLQADPTAIYGIKRFKEGVTKKDLLRKTPYNTYIIQRLPPGPISSPSLSSIKAALNPAKVPYLYFVANGDGSHTFSTTYDKHLLAINEIRRKKVE
jgi:UPF0755 protein